MNILSRRRKMDGVSAVQLHFKWLNCVKRLEALEVYNRCGTHNFFLQLRLVTEMLSYQQLTSPHGPHTQTICKRIQFQQRNEKLGGCAKCNSEKLHYKFGGYIKNADGLIWFSRWQRQTPDNSSATLKKNGTRNDVCVGDAGGKVDCGGKPWNRIPFFSRMLDVAHTFCRTLFRSTIFQFTFGQTSSGINHKTLYFFRLVYYY